MNRPTAGDVWSKRRPSMLFGATAVLVAGLAAGGCKGPTGEFFIVHNQAPGEGCTISADKNAVYLGQGTLDVRVPVADPETAYFLFPLVENDLPPEAEGGVEPNRIALSGFEMDLDLADGPPETFAFFTGLLADPTTASMLRYQSPWSASVSPGGGTTATATNAFPAKTAQQLRDANVLGSSSVLVNVKVRALGNKLGHSVHSDEFTYPLRVCDGCLINSITTCPSMGTVLQGGICNPGQDAPVDCCTTGADLICPATRAAR